MASKDGRCRRNRASTEIIRKQAGLNDGHNIGSGLKLTNYLKEKHLINVQIVPASEELKSVRKFDKEKKLFQLSEMLTYTSRNFHLAYQVAYLESEDIIDEIINTNNIESEEVRPLLTFISKLTLKSFAIRITSSSSCQLCSKTKKSQYVSLLSISTHVMKLNICPVNAHLFRC